MLDDLDYERQVRAWSRELAAAGAGEADVLHLHHLTPLNEAAARTAPGVPVVGQLHGTELLMLERIAAGPPPGWTHAERWASRIRGWASRCTRVAVAPAGLERALTLLGIPRERFIALPNGVDVRLFRRREIEREAFWRRVLVEEPRGALPGDAPGSLRYDGSSAARLARGVVLLYVGRFTAVKRLDRLIGAYRRAQERLRVPSGLVLVGGHPGEYEGEHPVQIAARVGARNVFLAGWHAHERLPEFFSAADAVVIASEREQFGQVLIEGMACGLPALATRSLGPASIVEDGRSGWLAAPDDEDALAAAMIEVVEDRDERARRGREARAAVCERFSWQGVATRLVLALEDVVGESAQVAALEA
jgi:glycosyltransferase involved in cell wall biosynthesis